MALSQKLSLMSKKLGQLINFMKLVTQFSKIKGISCLLGVRSSMIIIHYFRILSQGTDSIIIDGMAHKNAHIQYPSQFRLHTSMHSSLIYLKGDPLKIKSAILVQDTITHFSLGSKCHLIFPTPICNLQPEWNSQIDLLSNNTKISDKII